MIHRLEFSFETTICSGVIVGGCRANSSMTSLVTLRHSDKKGETHNKEPQSNIRSPIQIQTRREPKTSTTELIVSINEVIGAKKYQSSKTHINSEYSKVVDRTWAHGIRELEGRSELGHIKSESYRN